MSLNISIRLVNGISVVDLEGRITLGATAALLRGTMKELLAGDQYRILLNLSNVSYIDSSGLGELIGAFSAVSDRGGRLKLANIQPRVDELMRLTKLYSVFDIYDSEAEALRSFRARAAGA